MNIFGLIIIFLGTIMITMGYQKSKCVCENKVEYRYVPRTFREEQENLVKPSEIFRDMFDKPSVFIKDRTSI